jgi:hypothetical protein
MKKFNLSKQELHTLYSEFGSFDAVAKHINVGATTVKKYIYRYGIPLIYHRKYSVNDLFFDSLNEKSMYWLGFLAADGSIEENRISLAISTNDIGHLFTYKQDIDTGAPILTHNKYNKNTKKYYSISSVRVSSQPMVNALATYNIVNNKSYTFNVTDALKKHELFHHFLRGLIDGDGGIYKQISGSAITLYGTVGMIQNIFHFIQSELNIKTGYVNNDTNTHSYFIFSDLKSNKQIINYLYRDATVYLHRKYLKAQEILNTTPIKLCLNKNTVISLFNQHKNYTTVAKILDVSPSTIKRRIMEYQNE